MIDRRHFTQLVSLAMAAHVARASARVSGRAEARASGRAEARPTLKPKRLSPGDTVGLVAPASAAFEDEEVNIAKEQFEAMGLRVVVAAHAYDRYGYFAGTDRERADDVNRMFADDTIAGLVCFTGGWGSARILPMLDYALIARKPKVLVGFSDITAMLNAIHQKTGLVTFHGPVGASTVDPYSLENFRKVIMSPEPAGVLAQPQKKPMDLVDRVNRTLKLAPGKATGRLAGGNLTILSTLMGTPYEIDTDGAILFAEDIREEPYRIDRMLTQLALAGKFERMAGFVFGRCSNCVSTGPGFSLEEVLRDRFGGQSKPALSGLSFGHIEQKLTLPVGIRATLDGDAGTLTLDEGAVT